MESLDALIAMQVEGKIRHLALSNVNARELEQALARRRACGAGPLWRPFAA
jgi:aryl-alcohol dehydrogenase-like predicted oxidoreductase